MRQLNPLTNLVLALAFAGVLAAMLGLPWYAVPEGVAKPTDGPVERGAATIADWFSSSGATISGSEALGMPRVVLLALAGATAGLALLMLVPALRDALRSPLKLVPLAAPVVVAAQLFNAPDGMEVRFGVFAALGASLLMANSAFHGAEIRANRPAPAAPPPAHPGSAFRPPV